MKKIISILLLTYSLSISYSYAQLSHLGNMRNTFISYGLQIQQTIDNWGELKGDVKKVIYSGGSNSMEVNYNKNQMIKSAFFYSEFANEELYCTYDSKGNLLEDRIAITYNGSNKKEDFIFRYKKFASLKDNASILVIFDVEIDGQIKSFRADKIYQNSKVREQYITTFDKTTKKNFPEDTAFILKILNKKNIWESYEKEEITGYYYRKVEYAVDFRPYHFQVMGFSRKQWNLGKREPRPDGLFTLTDENNVRFYAWEGLEVHPDGFELDTSGVERTGLDEPKIRKLSYTSPSSGFYNFYGSKMPFKLIKGEFENNAPSLNGDIIEEKYFYDFQGNWTTYTYKTVAKHHLYDDFPNEKEKKVTIKRQIELR